MVKRANLYWAATWSWPGHLIGFLGRRLGAPPAVTRDHVVEYQGNPVMHYIPAVAIVFGNVINYRHLGPLEGRMVRRYDDRENNKPLVSLREHELQHVHQYRRWGPAFIPAYLVAELVARTARLAGRPAVNWFERCADDACRSYPRSNYLTPGGRI